MLSAAHGAWRMAVAHGSGRMLLARLGVVQHGGAEAVRLLHAGAGLVDGRLRGRIDRRVDSAEEAARCCRSGGEGCAPPRGSDQQQPRHHRAHPRSAGGRQRGDDGATCRGSPCTSRRKTCWCRRTGAVWWPVARLYVCRERSACSSASAAISRPSTRPTQVVESGPHFGRALGHVASRSRRARGAKEQPMQSCRGNHTCIVHTCMTTC